LDSETVSDVPLIEKAGWILTRHAMDKFLVALHKDRDSAGEQYEKIRSKLIRFFEWRGCAAPEELADEAISRMVRKVDLGETISDFHTYCYGIARLLLLEEFKRQGRERRAFESLRVSPLCQVEEDSDEQRRVNCLRACLDRLPEEQRELILQYYRGREEDRIRERRSLAKRLAIPLNALRIRACRIRESLESCVRQSLGLMGKKS
jgi:RNA polymerase sigma-70 factor, ECF subfamily